MTDDRLAELMVKQADGLATPDEQEELMAMIERHPELREELAAHAALTEVTSAWVERLQVDGLDDAWSSSPVTRGERSLGLFLVLGGVGLLTGFGLWEMLLDPAAPWWVKAGTTMVVVGVGLMLVSVVRWKWMTRGADRYSEVVR